MNNPKKSNIIVFENISSDVTNNGERLSDNKGGLAFEKRTKISLVLIAVVLAVMIGYAFYQYSDLSTLYGCLSNKETLTDYELPETYWEMEVSTSDGSKSLAEIAEILSKLTNEDGSGEINLNMTFKEITPVLDENGIPYTVIDGCIFTEDGSIYLPSLNKIYMFRTKKGLMVGESFSRAIKLYGRPDKAEDNNYYNNIVTYYYNMGKQYCEETDTEGTVVMTVVCADDTVITIDISYLMSFQEDEFFKVG